jgi:SAM-dependent methyltransferase
MEPTSGARLRDDLARYYDQDAAGRSARGLEAERVRRREEYATTLLADDVSRLLEVGTGPGVDAVAFRAAGLDVVGVDLSAEHVRLAREAGIEAHVAAAQVLPFADASFDALWCASVLMHMPDADLDEALAEFARVLRPGSPAALGMWGGDGTQGINPDDTLEPPRFFAWRTDQQIKDAIARHARIEQFDTWSVADAGGRAFHYQWCIARFGVDDRGGAR